MLFVIICGRGCPPKGLTFRLIEFCEMSDFIQFEKNQICQWPASERGDIGL